MRRLVCLFSTILCCAMFSGVVCGAYVPANANKTLIIFTRKSADSAGTLVTRQVVLDGMDCTSVEAENYKSGSMNGYGRAVIINGGEGLPSSVISDLAGYSGEICWIGGGVGCCKAVGASEDGLAYGADGIQFDFGGGSTGFLLTAPQNAPIVTPPSGAAVTGSVTKDGKIVTCLAFKTAKVTYFGLLNGFADNIKLKTALFNTLADFFRKSVSEPALYLDLDYIYPVSDFNTICNMAQYLKKNNLPFTFTVMPFYGGSDTESVFEYGRMLRYLEQCGGTPVIHIPVFSPNFSDDEPKISEVKPRLVQALKNYAAIKIYPLAFEMPENYIFRFGFSSLGSNFSDCFETEGDGKDVYTVGQNTVDAEISRTATYYGSVTNSALEIRLPEKTADYSAFYQKIAFCSNDEHTRYRISIPSWISLNDFKKAVDGIISHGIRISDFSLGTQTVSLSGVKIENREGSILYNGAPVGQISALPEQQKQTASKKSQNAVTTVLSGGNSMVILFSIGSMVILIIAFFVGRRKNKEKFLHRR